MVRLQGHSTLRLTDALPLCAVTLGTIRQTLYNKHITELIPEVFWDVMNRNRVTEEKVLRKSWKQLKLLRFKSSELKGDVLYIMMDFQALRIYS
jgi:hypothetical protein